MRILFLTAFYPPVVIGGWEQLVQELNEHLQRRGHTTHVLTSDHQLSSISCPERGVDRVLALESDLVHYDLADSLLKRRSRVQRNLALTREAIERFEPDVIFVHLMWNLTRGIPWMAEQMRPGRVVYYMANDWPYAPDPHTLFWNYPARRTSRRLLKRLLAPIAQRFAVHEASTFPLEFRRVLCVSNAVKDDLVRFAGIPAEHAQVVYNGINLSDFTDSHPEEKKRTANGALSLLYAGSLVPHKGVHTAIESVAHLSRQGFGHLVDLTIVGSGHPDYEMTLRDAVASHGLEERIRFQPRVPREGMPELLRQFDVLLFPSTWEEPLARMVQEAMAAGLVVVGTTTGGTKEILSEDETGLTFRPEDGEGLAAQIKRLLTEPELADHLRKNARDVVVRRFDVRRMIDEVESCLTEVVRNGYGYTPSESR